MNPKRAQFALLILVLACAKPSFAQIFWTNHSPAGNTDDVWSVAYANGTFAAVTNQGNLLTSADGFTWNSRSVAPGTWLLSIAFGDGTWVAVGSGGTILVSSDLKTWVSAAGVTTNRLNKVIYAGTQFIAVGENGTIITSPDALNWTVSPGPNGF